MTVTADGRDLSHEEWRTIPGLTKYEITADGDVRNRAKGRLLKEVQNPRTGAYAYHLWKDNGAKTSRSYQSLVRDAWGGAGEANGAQVAPVDVETKQGPQKGVEQ